MSDINLKNNFISVPPLNENYEENVKAFGKLFRKENTTKENSIKENSTNVPENAEVLAIDNLVFLHTKILPIPVYVELKTSNEKKPYNKLQQSLLQYFNRGWVIQIRPFTLKTIPDSGKMFLGVLCMVPYFKISTIVTNDQQELNLEKSDIKYVFCRGTQLLSLFQDNVSSILKISYKDPLMPKRQHCRHYTELNVFPCYSLRNFLSGVHNGQTKTLIEMPWVSINRDMILKQVTNNRNENEISKLLHVWPMKRIVCPVNDKIWEKPSEGKHTGEIVTLHCISTIKDNSIKTISMVFPVSETVPYWTTLNKPNSQPMSIDSPTPEPPKRTPKRSSKQSKTQQQSQSSQGLKKRQVVPNKPSEEKSDEIPFTVEREFSL